MTCQIVEIGDLSDHQSQIFSKAICAMAIAKAASRSVAAKAGKMSEAALDAQARRLCYA